MRYLWQYRTVGWLYGLADGTSAKPTPRRICGTKGLRVTVHKPTQGTLTTTLTTTTPTVVPNPAIWGFMQTVLYPAPGPPKRHRTCQDGVLKGGPRDRVWTTGPYPSDVTSCWCITVYKQGGCVFNKLQGGGPLGTLSDPLTQVDR